jgi:hypothetical protein
MGKYLLENVHAAYPSARCAIVVGSRGAMIRDLFAAYPWLEVIEANRRHPKALLSLWKNFHGSDLVVTQYAGKGGGQFGLASKFAARILARRGGLFGFVDSFYFNNAVYDHILPLERSSAPAELERAVLRVAGVSVALGTPSFSYVSQPHLLGRLGLQNVRYVVLHLFSGGNARGVSPEHRRALVSKLSRVMPDGLKLVLTGSKAECQSLGNGLPANALTVETSLQELSALIDASRGMVSVDTGAAHIAAQLRKPLIVLASCVGEQWWTKEMYGEGVPSALLTRADVCADGHDYSGYAKCLEAIDIDAVAQKAIDILL